MEDFLVTDNEQLIDSIHEIEKYQSSQCSKFFYSNDKFIDTIDDKKIYSEIILDYPEFKLVNASDAENRKTLIRMLRNSKFMNSLLDKHDMNIHDFFIFIYKIYPSMFNGLFVKKIQKTVKNRSYAKKVKYSKYKYRGPKKKSRRFKL